MINFLRNMRDAKDGSVYHLIWIVLFAVVTIGSMLGMSMYSENVGKQYVATNLNGSTIEFADGTFLSDSYHVVSAFRWPSFEQTIHVQIKGTVRIKAPVGATFAGSVYNPQSYGVSNQPPNLNVTWLLADGSKQTQIISDFCTRYLEAFVCIEPDLVLPQ